VVTGIVGCAGLIPTMSAINAGKNIALANKETLIAAGPIVIPALKKNNRYLDLLEIFVNLSPIIFLILFLSILYLNFPSFILTAFTIKFCVLLIKDFLTTSTSGNSGI